MHTNTIAESANSGPVCGAEKDDKGSPEECCPGAPFRPSCPQFPQSLLSDNNMHLAQERTEKV